MTADAPLTARSTPPHAACAHPSPRAPVTGADRVVAVLDAFRTGDRDVLGITDLARRTALPKSTVHRLANRLVAAGMLERDGSGLRLGMKLFELGAIVPRQRVLRDLAHPTLAHLRETTRHTVHLAIRAGNDVLYVEVLHGPDAPATPARVGGRWPVHAAAVGKAILAFSARDDIDAVLTTELARVSERTVRVPGLLAAELATIRRTGTAFDREESQAGLVCVAAPIFDASGVAASLSLSGWSTRMRPDRVAGPLLDAAATLSRRLRGD